VYWYKAPFFLVLLYGCEIWSLTLKEKLGQKAFDNNVLRICGPKIDEVVGGWKKLHNEELHNLYSSQNVIKMIKSRRTKWTEHVACMRGKRNMYVYDFGGKYRRTKTTR
jgi:hypothetical protein